MSHLYNGQGDAPAQTNGALAFIASTTNATPLGVTTTAPHGYNSGDTVEQFGADDPNAIGVFVITKTGASSYTLNGIAGTLNGGAHGYAQDFEVLPALTLPDNADLGDATVAGAVWEGLADTVPWLNRRAGTFRLYNRISGLVAGNVTDFFTEWGHTALAAAINELSGTEAPLLFAGGKPWIVAPGDLLDFSYSGTLSFSSTAHDSYLVPYYTDGTHVMYDNGADVPGFFFPGAGRVAKAAGGAIAQLPIPFTLRRQITQTQLVGGGLTSLNAGIKIGLAGIPSATSGDSMYLYGPFHLTVNHYKTNL